MKKLLTLLAIAFCFHTKAQYITIPDTAFVTYLHSNFPTAMVGNQMDTTNVTITTTTGPQSLGGTYIRNLFGIQYFKSLTHLTYFYNKLSSLQYLPPSLTYLNVETGTLLNIAALPNTLDTLYCGANRLTSLPALPSSLVYLSCFNDSLHNLPTLPNTMRYLDCDNTLLTNLPTHLPDSLSYLSCGDNNLKQLPTLPSKLQILSCNNDSLTTLPTLPNTLQILACWYNATLTTLPTLPNSLFELNCQYDALTAMPSLPNSLYYLLCNNNSLTGLPPLPSTLIYFDCSNNNITCFPAFHNFPLVYDYMFHQYKYHFTIDPNPYNCLPNYIAAMGNDTVSYPICAAGNTNGCNVATGINKIEESPQINIYPNPAQNHFTIETTNAEKQTLSVYDVNGKQVLIQTINGTSNIDASNLSAGVYNLNLASSLGAVNKHLVIIK